MIAACDEKCAVAIKNIQRKGNVPEPYTIDMCVETCATR